MPRLRYTREHASTANSSPGEALVTATGQQVNAILMDPVSEVPQSRTGKYARTYETDLPQAIRSLLEIERLGDLRLYLVFHCRNLSNLLLAFWNCHE
jgi:hypothetical protein